MDQSIHNSVSGHGTQQSTMQRKGMNQQAQNNFNEGDESNKIKAYRLGVSKNPSFLNISASLEKRN